MLIIRNNSHRDGKKGVHFPVGILNLTFKKKPVKNENLCTNKKMSSQKWTKMIVSCRTFENGCFYDTLQDRVIGYTS